ncbi:Hypothetical protein NTJ_03147 [Nesidiocoris tenuis]|uniref:C2H2-type domain-containing protein n=1 Tax=Nesidiocoris tenuis TaxID=355587 RepID=A0ABN7AHJ9_9HEMI|nr:Hypothetical protein NTJ_03147 [Nesidiocoris tenuis]
MATPMKNPNKGNPNRVKCDVCDVWCSDNVSFQNHIQGKPHYKVLAKANGKSDSATTTNTPSPVRKRKLEGTPGDYHCYTCNVNCLNTEQLEAHLKGSKHVKKLRLSDHETIDNPHIETLADGQGYRCKLCTVELTSTVTIKSHLEGMKHTKKLQDKETFQPSEVLTCKACNIVANSITQLELHNSSSKHLKKVAMLNKKADPPEPTVGEYKSYDAWDPSA